LLTGFAIALLKANGFTPSWDRLMQVLPEGEQFVGTRGGSMDHAVVLAGQPGHALYLQFDPLSFEPIPVPHAWAFFVCHSLQSAEKSGAVRERYNALRMAGNNALQRRGYHTFREALENDKAPLADPPYMHVLGEAARVNSAVAAMRQGDLQAFGRLMLDSHASLRDRLNVSTPVLDALVNAAVRSGAVGARLTGAGFGGCVLGLCRRDALDKVLASLAAHYAHRRDFHPAQHLFEVKPSAGALAYV
jgi:galactokinase